MKKTQITLDASKLRNLITEREYKNKEGKTVKVQEIKFDLVEMDAEKHKVVFSNDKMEIVKTSFAVQRLTDDERAAKTPTNYIGEGVEVRFKNDVQTNNVPTYNGNNPADQDDLPF
jgi:uncharacterized protein YcbX